MKTATPNPQRLPLDQAPLRSLNELEYLLGEDRQTLSQLADWKQNYSPFQQAKKPKPHSKKPVPTKVRQIDNPQEALKRVQTKILKRLLVPVKLPDFLFGAVPKRSVHGHAARHLGAKTIVKMDIQSYYPNITTRHVYKVWRTVLGCSPPVASLLTKLTTCDFYLPQGAPTSPAIANLLLASFYGPVLNACQEMGIVVTVWVDDLTFSGERAREIIEPVRQTLAANGFKASQKKLHILGSKDAKHVTGPRLGAHSIRACKSAKAEVRAGIYNVRMSRFTTRGRSKDIQSLQGKISYLRSLCPTDAAQLQVQLDTCGAFTKREFAGVLVGPSTHHSEQMHQT
jgi:RNA-directed DNA polymerase